ncbi:MAG: hypothetical protein DLM56_07700 [Pseudonocardiales bacterium]|nr:MAG: hypothetical protein DLM56_07700 [Pseudonocardiales bacterium]
MSAPLVLDLREERIDTLEDFWDAVSGPLALPDWFGRNLDAWWDTIGTGHISSVIDAADPLVIQARRAGLFAPGNRDGAVLAQLLGESAHARLDLDD